jgi:hypothetical protein
MPEALSYIARHFVSSANQLTLCDIEYHRRLASHKNRKILRLLCRQHPRFPMKAVAKIL